MDNLIGKNDIVPNFNAGPGEPMEPREEVKYQCVLSELDVAITFASSATHQPITRYTFETAKKAYSEGLYYLIGASSEATLSRPARQRVMAKLTMLDAMFRELGV